MMKALIPQPIIRINCPESKFRVKNMAARRQSMPRAALKSRGGCQALFTNMALSS
jgi:hypothetical protein